MKFIKHFTIVFITAIAFCVNVDSFGQVKWVPTTISINTQVLENHNTWSNCPNNPYDSNSPESVNFILNFTDSGIQQYSRIGDSIYLFCLGPNRECNQGHQDGFSISFNFDSLQGKINNLYLYYTGPDNANGCIDPFDILITSLNFVISDDTTLVAGGAIPKNSVRKMDLRDIDFVGECSSEKGYYYGSEWHIDSLLEGVNFSIIFVNSKPINSVTSPITATQNFNVVNYFPFNRADFTFPSSDHPQQITIYDILGREVKRIEIPAGSTSYAMSSVGYPKGTYFARLGLQTASFMMN